MTEDEFHDGITHQITRTELGRRENTAFRVVIGGRRYDSENMEKVATARSNWGRNDFRYYVEVLYRAKSGAYLLAGEGHALTVWQFDTGNGHTFGHGYAVLTPDQARQWLEFHRRDDLIDELFGSKIEDA